jgi:hypothetical protein
MCAYRTRAAARAHAIVLVWTEPCSVQVTHFNEADKEAVQRVSGGNTIVEHCVQLCATGF